MNKIMLGLIALAVSEAVSAAPSLTIYNQNFAVIKEPLDLSLATGVTPVSYTDMTHGLEPDSVMLRAVSDDQKFSVLEQNYLAEPASEQSMLRQYEGQEIEFLVESDSSGFGQSTVTGTLLRSTAGQAVVEIDGKVRFGLPGTPIFPDMSHDTHLKPTLTWQIHSDMTQNIAAELSYLTSGLSWESTYNVFASDSDSDRVDVTSWVTVENLSGKKFEQAQVKLMAGDVNRVQAKSQYQQRGMMMEATAMKMGDSADSVSGKTFGDLHLYTLDRALDLGLGEKKQVEFVRATQVLAPKKYVFDAVNVAYKRSSYQSQPNSGEKVSIYRTFKNTKESGLGMPLPKGVLKFYQKDNDDSVEFVGENLIDHTPVSANVDVRVGTAFDITGEKVQTLNEVDQNNKRASEAYKITLKNSKQEAVTVHVVEHLRYARKWSISEESLKHSVIDASTIEYVVEVPADGEANVEYKVDYKW